MYLKECPTTHLHRLREKKGSDLNIWMECSCRSRRVCDSRRLFDFDVTKSDGNTGRNKGDVVWCPELG